MNDKFDNLEQEFERYAELLESQNDLGAEQMIEEIVRALNGAKSAGGIVKDLIDLTATLKNSELSHQLARLDHEMADMEGDIAAATRKITALEEDKYQLEKQIERLKKPLVLRDNGAYYTEDGKGGPFCTFCYDKEKLELNLHLIRPPRRGRLVHADHECLHCKTPYKID